MASSTTVLVRSFLRAAGSLLGAASLLALASGCDGRLIGTPRDGATPSDGACPSCAGDGGAGHDAAAARDAGGGAPVDGGGGSCGTCSDGSVADVDAGTVIVPTCGSTATPAPVTFSPIAAGVDVVGPGRGAAAWHGHQDVDVPTEGSPAPALDDYYRFLWTQLERSAGVYDWSPLDSVLDDAIAHRRRLSFGLMSACPGCSGLAHIDGANSAYPADLHTAMQAESPRDWISDGNWTPNWNSPTYLARYEALLVAINAHLEAGSHAGVRYADAIGTIDIRGYGSWGEWHVAGIADTVDDQPPGRATTATLERLVDMHVSAFPTQQLVAMICIFDGDRFGNMGVSVEVAQHMLAAHNTAGAIGWRRDNWGALDSYLRDLLDRNPEPSVHDPLMSRWQTAPIVGEPPGYDTTAGGCAYSDLETQVRRYHAAWFGNGNYAGAESASCMRDNVRAAAQASGYRLALEGGSVAPVLYAGASAPVTLDWHNLGLAPVYETWDVVLALRDAGGATVASVTSAFRPRLFLPATGATEATDDLVLPADVPAGSYDLVVAVRDPTGLRDPLPLAIDGRRSDGSYLVQHVDVRTCP